MIENKVTSCNVSSSFGQKVQSAFNPECLYPRPVWPQGNNGNLLTGTLVAGSANQWPPNSGPDNQFPWTLIQWTYNASSLAWVAQTITGTMILSPDFYPNTSTGPSIADAFSSALNAQVLPQVNPYISSFSASMLGPSGPDSNYSLQVQLTASPSWVTSVPGSSNPGPPNTFTILPTAGSKYKFAGGYTDAQMLFTGSQNTSPYSLFSTFTGSIAPMPALTGININYLAVNTNASIPDFNFQPDIADPQTRAAEFNQVGLVTLDGSHNQGQPPWVFIPGQDSSATGPTNVCSNAEGLGATGSAGLTQLQPIAGQCQKRPNQDTCQNPCIRDPNTGQLKPNPQISQCRVFSNLSDANSEQCPTVCPQQCVELWESCPVGTGLLTTLQNTQNESDVLSLQGPTLADGTVNPQFPSTRNGTNTTLGPWPNPNRPQKECYAQGTTFCSLSLANLYQQPTGGPICAAPCPNGFVNIDTFCTGNNAQLPICSTGAATGANQWDDSKKLLGSFFNGAQICVPQNPQTKNVVCDPNQFTPWYGITGTSQNTILGCATKPISVLTGTSCPVNTNTQVNELFSVEWCNNACQNNQVADPSQTTCIATCNGAIWDSNEVFLQQWDQYDIFLTTGKCLTGTNCSQNGVPGQCPAQTQSPLTSNDLVDSVRNHGLNGTQSLVDAGSIQNELPYDQSELGLSKKSYASKIQQIAADQENNSSNSSTDAASNKTSLAMCPEGMEMVVHPQNGEIPGFCQDKCQPGFKPIRLCRSSNLTNIELAISQDPSLCPEADLVFACLPDCPQNWVPDNRVPGVYNCVQRYPNYEVGDFPADPAEWKTCPDDGRYKIVDQSNGSLNKVVTAGGISYGPAMCVRKPQPRLFTCPINQQENTDNKTCTKLCGENDIVVQGAKGIKCARACTSDGRFIQQQQTMQDPNVDPAQEPRQCARNAIFVGAGSDANLQVSPSQQSRTDILIALFTGLGILLAITLYNYVTSPVRK